MLLHLYYGRRCEGSMEYLLTYADRGFASNIYDAADDRTYSTDILPQEFPVSGTGDMRSTALVVEYGNGIQGCDLRYAGYQIRDGKYGLKGLPAVYAAENEAQTLEIVLRDTAGMAEVTLLYGVLPELDIITRSVGTGATTKRNNNRAAVKRNTGKDRGGNGKFKQFRKSSRISGI